MLKKYLIEKPMLLNFYATLLLKMILIIILTYLLFISKDITLLFAIGIVFVSLILFYKKNKKELEIDLGSAKEQIQKIIQNASVKISWNLLTYTIMYVVLYIYYHALIMMIENDLLRTSVNNVILGIIIILLFYRYFYYAYEVAPILILLFLLIPLILLSMVGIETSLLNWTFISFIVISIIPQLINKDILFLLPKDKREKIKIPEDELRERLYLIKFNLLSFVPLLYISLLLTEKVLKFSEILGVIEKYLPIILYDLILKLIFINISLFVWFKFRMYFYNKISNYLLNSSDKLDEAHKNKLKREKEEKAELERLKSEMNKLNLNTEVLVEKRTEWVVNTTEGIIIAISVNTEKAEVTLNNNKATMEKAGFTYKNSVTEGTVTRHIFSTEKSITERTIWYDTEENILFEETGLQDPEYLNHHETFVDNGYELIDSGQFDSHDEDPAHSKTLFSYLYKKVSNSTTTTPETRPNFRYPEVKPETKSETKPTANESNITPRTSKENVKSTETPKEEITVESPEEMKFPEVKKEELPKIGMADSFGTIATTITLLVVGLGVVFTGKKKQ